MPELLELFLLFLQYTILLYSFLLSSSYLILAVIAIRETVRYLHKNSFIDYKVAATSPFSPGISILAPAYNESETIIDNVRSLLSINYNKLEVIIINDGSKDNSLDKLIIAYELKKVDFFYDDQLKTQAVRGIYKSANRIFRKLTVVDKENGGKADALNVGINISTYDLIACNDVDCILEQDAMLKMVKPFVEKPFIKTIATGGALRIANSCVVESGRITKVKIADKLMPRFQTLEYIRAFILGRMAWSRLNGLLIISGAFGMFDKKTVVEAGGYDVHTVGEDMELVVRMRRIMHEKEIPYRVAYIPDPLCWTEVPESFKLLKRQRHRWARGTVETLATHKIMFFNRKYKNLGLISYPYWFFFEFLAPIIEFLGLLLFVLLSITGLVNWEYSLILIFSVISFSIMFSAFAIFSEEITYHQYSKRSDIAKLLLIALMEPFIFHPFGVIASLSGHLDKLLKRDKGWGEMVRKGFDKL